MTMTEIRPGSSIYPPTVDELLPRARELTARLGALPSRNRLMRELRIGANKAAMVLAELATDTTRHQPADADQAPSTGPAPVEPEPAGEHPTDEQPTEERPAAVLPAVTTAGGDARPVRSWPVLLLALPAFVAIWSGWVGLGGLTGFGTVHPLPGIWDSLSLNTAITLPIGMETYAAFALRAWLSPGAPVRARRFAKWSAIGALGLGAAGQVAYHLMTATGITAAPWPITTVVACLPVAVLGMGAALAHLLHDTEPDTAGSESGSESGEVGQ